MPSLTPEDKEQALRRIASIDAAMIEIQRRAAVKGEDLRPEWDKLFAERLALEDRIWGALRNGQK